jgi:hypothetical protein
LGYEVRPNGCTVDGAYSSEAIATEKKGSSGQRFSKSSFGANGGLLREVWRALIKLGPQGPDLHHSFVYEEA